MIQLTLRLIQKARKSGGDKYAGEYQGIAIELYFPQNITRVNSEPVEILEITITPKEA